MSVFGIDFGTTNSAAVKISPRGERHKYGDETGRPMPSIVAIDKATGEILGGREVWENREKYAESAHYHLIQSIKLMLGTDESWQTEDGVKTPEDITAWILKSLSERAAKVGLEPITNAAITIPVGFPPKARVVLRRAAEMAGIKVNSFVTESTAALMKYYPDLRHCRHIAVFDWGGGTLDVSILELRDSSVTELAIDGMDLAGDAIDMEVARKVHEIIMQSRGDSIAFESMSAVDRDTLRTKCEQAKCDFERKAELDIILTSYGGRPAVVRGLKREWFEAIVVTYVDLAIDLLARTMERAKLRPEDISRLLIIGGTARLRLLHEKLRNDSRFSAAFQPANDAEWDVAIGAAILQDADGGYETSESIGLVLSDNSYYELIPPASTIRDLRHSLTLSLVEDAPQANIVVAKKDSRHTNFQQIVAFGVDALGFDLEGIQVTYEITPDLVFRIQAESMSVGLRSRELREYGALRFSYHL